ncbi:hypothetical protein Pmani_007305 [Petrolisthes manimaculis]|uniref:Integrase catalytic domain-containing protein n=1 Tax=Petrolisthes manimaculis TaxID=1843537 RepID=A0AAE1Q8N9_9EUCA|nr:hypothetical protein Pmani_007305 [Petrolisthes manimaculis]
MLIRRRIGLVTSLVEECSLQVHRPDSSEVEKRSRSRRKEPRSRESLEESYPTLIDCGPSRCAIWRPLRLQTSASVVQQLKAIFFERGAPEELVTDNDTAFRSRMFSEFAK